MAQPEDILSDDSHANPADGAEANQTSLADADSAATPRPLTLVDLARGTGFAPEAFVFLQRGLSHTVDATRGDEDEPRHVSGPELCHGLREYALGQWGMMAEFVLNRWGVTTTGDFGAMVFHLVAHEVLATTEDDRPEDFEDVFDFAEAFGGYRMVV